ncbi:MAG TPA: Uma2 family endonuclease [Candidatus Obscuribacterales bacterium]
MATAHKRVEEPRRARLYNGDHMGQKLFHRIYCQMPSDYHAELIGGIVFEPSPVSVWHGTGQIDLGYLLKSYSMATRGTKVAAGATLILSDEDEVEPDLMLRVAQERGGASYTTRDGFIKGAPELVAEIAYSSRAIDLHMKKERYALAGVVEYIVVCLRPKKIYWFDLRSGAELIADKNGVFQSKVFPGLWIHEKGLLESDDELIKNTLERGLRTAQHSEFVARLTAS